VTAAERAERQKMRRLLGRVRTFLAWAEFRTLEDDEKAVKLVERIDRATSVHLTRRPSRSTEGRKKI
jgi:hypothetical protein